MNERLTLLQRLRRCLSRLRPGATAHDRARVRSLRTLLAESAESARLEGAASRALAEPLTAAGIQGRTDALKAELQRIAKDYLGDTADKHALAGEIAGRGGDALELLYRDEDALARRPGWIPHLEAFILTDGTRPTFLIQDGTVDFNSSPATSWRTSIGTENLDALLACTGGISLDGKLRGTGFRVAPGLILTNRHVVQHYVQGSLFTTEAVIDFNGEFRPQRGPQVHTLTNVAFLGPETIPDGAAQHALLDLAAVRIGPAANDAGEVLSVDLSAGVTDSAVYVVGFPGKPGRHDETYPPTLLETFFESLFGYKRLAPGRRRMSQRPQAASWTVAHDATTLGGNSGSVVVSAGTSFAAAGLHYGGSRESPAENWAHSLAAVLASPAGAEVRRVFDAAGVVYSPRN